MRYKFVVKDFNSRVRFGKCEMYKYVLKSLLSSNYDLKCRIYFSKILWRFGKLSSISFCRCFCTMSANSRSVFRRFKLNRHLCKKLASIGFLVGMRKSSF